MPTLLFLQPAHLQILYGYIWLLSGTYEIGTFKKLTYILKQLVDYIKLDGTWRNVIKADFMIAQKPKKTKPLFLLYNNKMTV